MPLVTRPLVLALGIVLLWVAPSIAQPPGQGGAMPGAHDSRAPQIPWTGGERALPPRGQPRLLPTAHHQPLPHAAAPGAVRPAAAQGPVRLSPKPADDQSVLGGRDLKPLATGAASLGIVLGLFLLLVWSVKRGLPRESGLLPTEAVEVLGRAPIGSRQHVHLVRCGNKIVLLNVGASSVETLTEITDPHEIERLQKICRGTTAPLGALQQLLGKLGNFAPGALRTEQPDRLDFEHLEVGNYPRA